jgi:hypothetical protein
MVFTVPAPIDYVFAVGGLKLPGGGIDGLDWSVLPARSMLLTTRAIPILGSDHIQLLTMRLRLCKVLSKIGKRKAHTPI